jgi:hypothetical protein
MFLGHCPGHRINDYTDFFHEEIDTNRKISKIYNKKPVCFSPILPENSPAGKKNHKKIRKEFSMNDHNSLSCFIAISNQYYNFVNFILENVKVKNTIYCANTGVQ